MQIQVDAHAKKYDLNKMYTYWRLQVHGMRVNWRLLYKILLIKMNCMSYVITIYIIISLQFLILWATVTFCGH